MLPKAIAVAVVSSIALAAGGCGGGSDAEAKGRVELTKLRAELKERFGTPPNEAPWYRHITAINWADGQPEGYRQVEVATDLKKGDYNEESEYGEFGGIPCGLLWGVAFEQVGEPPELSVAIVDAEGNVGGCA